MPETYAQEIIGNVKITGRLDVTQAFIDENSIKSAAALPRANMAQDSYARDAIPFTDLRVWDNMTAGLPQTAASDDLAIIEGTLGTDVPTVQTSDAKNTTVTQYARLAYKLPADYQDGESIRVYIRAGMITTIASASATVDLVAYGNDTNGAVDGTGDRCATAAQSINSLTKADLYFTITPTSLTAGDQLDMRIAIAITDSATATAVIGEISLLEVQYDRR